MIVLPYSIVLAMVGLIESLLTLNLVDALTDTRGQANRESLAQGIANSVTGFFGGMGGKITVLGDIGRHRLQGVAGQLLSL